VSGLSDRQAELSPREVAGLLARGEIELIDVRETYEHEAGHIAGARHLPLGHLAGQAEEIDRNKPVVFLCRLGARSAIATQAFSSAGWDARNMAGGIVAWHAEGLPLAPAGGYVADH
jgi:rhodanese-related sulfurtransferase